VRTTAWGNTSPPAAASGESKSASKLRKKTAQLRQLDGLMGSVASVLSRTTMENAALQRQIAATRHGVKR